MFFYPHVTTCCLTLEGEIYMPISWRIDRGKGDISRWWRCTELSIPQSRIVFKGIKWEWNQIRVQTLLLYPPLKMDTLVPANPCGVLVHLEMDGVGETLPYPPPVWFYCLGGTILATVYFLVDMVHLFNSSRSRMLM